MEDLQRQINALKMELDNLKRTNAIPKEVEDSFKERLGGIYGTGTSTVSGPIVYGNFPVTVPASAAGTLTVTYKGVVYNLLYK